MFHFILIAGLSYAACFLISAVVENKRKAREEVRWDRQSAAWCERYMQAWNG